MLVSHRRNFCLATSAQEWLRFVRVRITALIVLIGLLAQAVAFVRHNGAVLGHALNPSASASVSPAPRDLMRDLLTAICQPGGNGSTAAVLPGDAPDRDNALSTCPICNGLASAYALPAPEPEAAAVRFLTHIIDFPPYDARFASIAFVRPQSRGPPVRA